MSETSGRSYGFVWHPDKGETFGVGRGVRSHANAVAGAWGPTAVDRFARKVGRV